jgi:hypothetical protein
MSSVTSAKPACEPLHSLVPLVIALSLGLATSALIPCGVSWAAAEWPLQSASAGRGVRPMRRFAALTPPAPGTAQLPLPRSGGGAPAHTDRTLASSGTGHSGGTARLSTTRSRRSGIRGVNGADDGRGSHRLQQGGLNLHPALRADAGAEPHHPGGQRCGKPAVRRDHAYPPPGGDRDTDDQGPAVASPAGSSG